jgi:5-methylcytosine-specific restriction endonuclease McrA
MGYKRIDYGDTWDEKREDALERDGYECRICGKGQSIKEPLHVHHITKVRKFLNPDNAHTLDNMITLCKTHHRLVETGRIDCPDPNEVDKSNVDNPLDF